MNNTIDLDGGPPLRQILAPLQRFRKIIPLAFLVLIALFTAVYQVPAESDAVILRFGKSAKTVGPGLHFKLPFGIDQKVVVPVRRQLKMEFGFGATHGATNVFQSSFSRKEQNDEMSMITGDRNAALVEWVVQYRIDDPESYLFRVRNPELTLRDASESVMREVVGDRTVDEVITIGRQGIETEALVKMQKLVDDYGLGFSINQVQLKNVNPPRAVQASFNEVNQAQQERERMINIARGEYNKLVPKAKGEADQKVAQAEGRGTQRINEATGDAERFLALFAEYEKAPRITRERLYLEKMQQILPRLKNKIIIDEQTTGMLPLLHLGEGKTLNSTTTR